MLASDFVDRVAAVKWQDYETAYGNAAVVERQLRNLVSSDHDTAMTATHDLWCGLCHQHAYVSSAALPACPLLLEVFDATTDLIRVELMDIFLGFVSCTHPQHTTLDWQYELHALMTAELPRFRELANHSNSDIVDFAELILESFDAASNA